MSYEVALADSNQTEPRKLNLKHRSLNGANGRAMQFKRSKGAPGRLKGTENERRYLKSRHFTRALK